MSDDTKLLDSHTSTPDRMIAVFPLTGKHQHMAVGLALPVKYDFSTANHNGISIRSAGSIYWDNAAYWVYEGNVLTTSSEDMDAYSGFMHFGNTAPPSTYKAHMTGPRFDIFDSIMSFPIPKEDRRFARLPVRLSNQVKYALLKAEGVDNLPLDVIPSPAQEEKEVFGQPLHRCRTKHGLGEGIDPV